MQKLTVNIDDRDMAAIEAEARDKHVAPEAIVTMKVRDSLRQNPLTPVGYAKNAVAIYKMSRPRSIRQASAKEYFQLATGVRPSQAGSVRLGVKPATYEVKIVLPRRLGPESKSQVKVAKPSREERKAALMKMRELWHPDPDAPTDGVEYQKAMRAEWR